LGLQVREGMDSPQDLKIASFKITAIAMDGERRRGAPVKAGVGEVRLCPIDGPCGQH